MISEEEFLTNTISYADFTVALTDAVLKDWR